jgi:hypothetical protein
MNIPVFPETNVALKGKKGLIVGIANDQSIAWGCAQQIEKEWGHLDFFDRLLAQGGAAWPHG